jgi:transcription factor TGA
MAFDAEYARWLEEHNRQTNELRAAINSHAGDIELRTIVDNFMTQFEDIYRLKGVAAKADVFHILSGMWKTPAERCFMWIGGFRSSEILKVRNFSFVLFSMLLSFFSSYNALKCKIHQFLTVSS